MRQNKGLFGLAVLALLAFTITATLGGAASADPVAQTAGLKKCLKKAKRIQDPVKRKKAKKRCRAKFGGTAPVAPTSIVRATLNWFNGGSNDVDMDLFVFDGSGNRAGNGSDAISQSSLSSDVQGASGSETFTDQNAGLHRPLSFGVCYTVGGSVHTDYTITYVTADGSSHTDTRAGDNSLGSSAHVDYPADGVAIPSGYCPN